MEVTMSDEDLKQVVQEILDAHPEAGLKGNGDLNTKGEGLAKALLKAVQTHITPSRDTGAH